MTEQFPQQPEDISTKGQHAGNLEGPLHEAGVVNFSLPLSKAVSEGRLIDRESLQPVQDDPAPFTEEELAEARRIVAEKHAPKKETKFGLGAKIGAAAAALAVAAGLWGINANANKDDAGASPAPQPTAAGLVTPGATEAPAPTAPAETEQPVSAENFTFTTGEGAQSVDDLKESLAISMKEVKLPTDVVPAVVERMSDAANWLPTEADVRKNLNKPTEQLSVDDFMTVYDEYLGAHDVMFSVKAGDFYDTLQKLCKQSAYNHILSVANGDAVPYAVNLELHTNDTGLRITHNSTQPVEGTVDASAMDYLGNYRLLSSGVNDVVSDNGNWYVSGKLELIRKDEEPTK